MMYFTPKYPTKQHQYGWWTENVLVNLVCRYHSQGGTDYKSIQNEAMQKDLDKLLETVGEELSYIHDKAWKILKK